MKYKGYTILANVKVTKFFEVSDDSETEYSTLGDQVEGINYDDGDDGEYWYSVIDKDHWVVMSYESIEECKQFIREEVKRNKVPEMELKVPYIKPKNLKSEKEVG